MKIQIIHSKLKTLEVSCFDDSNEIASKNESLNVTLESDDSMSIFTGFERNNPKPHLIQTEMPKQRYDSIKQIITHY